MFFLQNSDAEIGSGSDVDRENENHRSTGQDADQDAKDELTKEWAALTTWRSTILRRLSSVDGRCAVQRGWGRYEGACTGRLYCAVAASFNAQS